MRCPVLTNHIFWRWPRWQVRRAGQDPVDGAIRAAAAHKAISDAPKPGKFAPFDPAKKMSEATATDSTGDTQRIVKGAFAAVVGLAPPSPAAAAAAKNLKARASVCWRSRPDRRRR